MGAAVSTACSVGSDAAYVAFWASVTPPLPGEPISSPPPAAPAVKAMAPLQRSGARILNQGFTDVIMKEGTGFAVGYAQPGGFSSQPYF